MMITTTPTINFFESISASVQMKEESRKAVLAIMRKDHLPKGHVLVPVGSICNHVYYIERGLARIFYLKDGKEVTEDFNAENSFTCSITSYVNNKPDNRQIELLEPSIIWSIPYRELEPLYDQYHEVERLGRYLITQELVEMQKRLTDIQFMSAQERYSNFVADNPSLMQRIPLGLLSSYLGITQETLSRIRSKV